jgi:hypothetical protein
VTRFRPAVLDNPNAYRDGLLLTTGERAQLFLIKLALAFAPSLLLALVAVATGGYVVALVAAIVGGLTALTAATSVRRLRGALVVGLTVAAGLVVVNLVLAWLTTHPMLPGG